MHIWNTCRRSRALLESNWQEIIWASYFIRHAFIYAAPSNLLTLEFFSLKTLCKKSCLSIYNIVHTITSSNVNVGVIVCVQYSLGSDLRQPQGSYLRHIWPRARIQQFILIYTLHFCNSEQWPKERSPGAQTLFNLLWNMVGWCYQEGKGTKLKQINSAFFLHVDQWPHWFRNSSLKNKGHSASCKMKQNVSTTKKQTQI